MGRLLEVTLGDPYSNVALEEALFKSTRVPTLRFWENQKSVVIGRAQVARSETDVELCRKRSIPVVRRFSAGGAVYNGPGNLNWSFFVDKESWGVKTKSPAAIFASFAEMIVDALLTCGVKAWFKPPNSVAVSGGKVSGMAAYVSDRKVLCHGTLLVAADLREVQRLTRPRGRLAKKYPRSRHTKVANCGVEVEEFVVELAKRSGFGYEIGGLTRSEVKEVDRLVASKYATEGWNFGDPFELDYL